MGFVRARVPRDDAEDVFQLAALRAVEKADSLQDPERVVPWLFRVYRNMVTDLGRARSRQRRLFDQVEQVPELAEQADVEAEAEACGCSVTQSKRITGSYAGILDLIDIKGLSLREAADSLGISVNNATVRLHRARKALKKRMLEHCGVESLRDCLDCLCGYVGCCAA